MFPAQIRKHMRFFLLFSLILVGCAKPFSGGPITMTVIQPKGPSCQYQVAPATLFTLESITELRGGMGTVVTHPDDLESRPEILELGFGFRPLDLRLSGSGTNYGPLDKSSLLGLSKYFALEQGFFLFKNLDTSGDLSEISRVLRSTLIIQNAILTSLQDSDKKYSDNAAYVQVEGSEGPRDYFLTFPNDKITTIPLGFNMGVMVHEFTHLVTQHFFHEKRAKAGKNLSDQSENVLASIEEGNADYFAFLATQDPSFFHCSFPGGVDRDLAHPKVITSDQIQSIRTSVNFDSHEIGAIWASVQYQIGQVIGHEANGRSLVNFIRNLSSCTGLGNSRAEITLGTLRNCHLQNLGSLASQAQTIYQNAFAGGL